ncbi:PH domain-containing protein [Dokdonella sp.]|uniref:PH domain-containing protein n=1 Tax=Dokdonella sp. TaxID=2291710 RepID=UPI001B069205|nr:PH domain-containing protein [Dokdonella sp.]MBO9664134.1 PH domain-containing protein [Dokdonella sp.]
MSYLDESLAPGESIVARFELHWTAKWRLIVFLVLAIPTLGLALLGALYEWIRLRSIEQGVTNRRVVRKTGIVSRITEELRLASIETIDLRQSAWGRLLGYGDVVLTGRGESAMIFARLAAPIDAKRAIEGAYAAHVEDTRARQPAASP